jgi:hypothetical protein
MTVEQPDASARAEITRQRETFQRLLGYGCVELEHGRGESAGVYAQLAADYAWHNHPGLFASARLEQLLRSLAGQLPSRVARPRAQGSRTRVLHVLTAAYSVGGHTRLALRWMLADADRSHSVLVTSQTEFSAGQHQPVPRELLDTVAETGGDVFELNDRADGILARAQTLREVAADFDFVVLHIHPWDAVPAIALDVVERPPVLFMNHADHVFWTGASVGDLVLHIRDESVPISERFRGLAVDRTFVLPVPLVPRSVAVSRREARRRLGMREDSVVLLSVGSAHKYKTSSGPHFAEVALRVLERYPEAVLVVVGPSNGTKWRQADERSGGRVHVFGPRDDLELFLAAADVFLNSFPLGSLTTALEAALNGVPVVNYEVPGTTFIRSSDRALTAEAVHQRTLEGYVDQVSAMIADETTRRTMGNSLRESVIRWHCGDGWKAMLEDLYGRVRRVGRTDGIVDVDDRRDLDAVDYAVHQFNVTTRYSRTFSEARVIDHVRFLRPDQRLLSAARMRRTVGLTRWPDAHSHALLDVPRRYVAADPLRPAPFGVFIHACLEALKTKARGSR